MAKKRKVRTIQADDVKEPVSFLLRLRLPWLVVGAIGGFLSSMLISRFEHILSTDVRLAFFLPLIVYLSDAVGTQTETIYIRNIKGKKGVFAIYLHKEIILGILFGLIFGVATAVFTYVWFKDPLLSAAISLAMAAAVATAPLVALFMAAILQKEHQDPAVGAGPFTTILQDLVSILIYFGIASLILFR